MKNKTKMDMPKVSLCASTEIRFPQTGNWSIIGILSENQ